MGVPAAFPRAASVSRQYAKAGDVHGLSIYLLTTCWSVRVMPQQGIRKLFRASK